MQALAALRLFNEKAAKLERLSFVQHTFHERTGFNLSWSQEQPAQIQRYGPNEESVDAFVLTFRFFIQDNEKSSFRNVAQLYGELPINPESITKFNEARDMINSFLDTTTFMTVNDHQLTNRNIFEVFLWGGLAHANSSKKSIYDTWAQNPLLFPILQNEFIAILANFLRVIFYVRTLNIEVIRELEGNP